MAEPQLNKTFNYKTSIIIVLLALAVLALSLLLWYMPGFFTYQDENAVLIWNDKAFANGELLFKQNEPYLSVNTIKSTFDPNIHWDPEEKQLIITTADKVVRMHTEKLTVSVNNKPLQLEFPVLLVQGEPYVQLKPLKKIYNLNLAVCPKENRAVLLTSGKPLQKAVITKETILRTGPGLRHQRLTKLPIGTEVTIFSEVNGWYHVLSNGQLGYVQEDPVNLRNIELVPQGIDNSSYIKPKIQGKINFTWEQVSKVTPDTSRITPPPGVNVVSPTWFYLKDSEGTVGNRADGAYVRWAHSKGYQVWALFSNDFNPEKTHNILRSAALRQKVINQLLMFAELYELNGINLDFENVYLEDKELLVQFVRELTPLFHEQGLTVSMDVTVKSNSANWSLFYNRKALGEAVDYIMLMAYDEHWSTSPKAGSVASLPWVEKGILGLLEEVPREKLVLGIPFYTRLWEEKRDDTGKITVSSRIFNMDAAKGWVKQNGLTPKIDASSGQNFAQLQQNGSTFKIWLEDEHSVRQRLALVDKYGLAGVASWRRGYEEPRIWEIIAENLKKTR